MGTYTVTLDYEDVSLDVTVDDGAVSSVLVAEVEVISLLSDRQLGHLYQAFVEHHQGDNFDEESDYGQ
jgi:hypothetical protein